MSRWFQFSLRTLLVFTAIAAVSAHWWTLRHHAAVARRRFEEEKSHIAGPDILWEASNRVLVAELDLPFTDERNAWQSHWERLRFIEMRVFAHSVMPSREWMRKRERTLAAIAKERESIGRRFGLPSD